METKGRFSSRCRAIRSWKGKKEMHPTIRNASIGSLLLLLAGCAVVDRIVVYETGPAKGMDKSTLALLYASDDFHILSIDGDNTSYSPAMGAYGGSHIYLKPGVHSIKFGWANRSTHTYLKDDATARFEFKAGRYHELDVISTIGEPVRFGMRDLGAIPAELPETGLDKIRMGRKD